MGTPPVYNQATRPVSVSEFKDVISAICPPRWRMARATRSRPVALAVSGGLDSMALAYLFYSTAKTYGSTFAVADNPVASVYGLVIDHDLREGSAQEARTVCGWLTNIGIRGRSYTLGAKANKGQPVDLREQTNFETTARYLRYRTLGLAASELGATSVFSAHHKDDQYETLLMRLIAGHKYRGLQGIRAANPIPECHDLHGIYNSGLLDDQQHNYPFLSFKPSNRTIRRIRTMFQEDRTEETLEQADSLRPKLADWLPGHFDRDIDPHVPYLSPIPCEDGGIVIYRPLLDFDKDRLRATCEAYKVPWVEDHTNADPTITVRNAVRHMVRYNTLPKALQKPAILGLGERAKRRVEFEEAEARRLLIREAVIKDFDTNVGTILVELPTFRWSVRRLYREAREEAWRPHRRRIAGLVIRKLMDFVTPDKHLPTLSNLDTAINAMFPELRSGPRSIQPKAFSMGSILFEPIHDRTYVARILVANDAVLREPH
ncbi:PP-loop family protein [Sarocladium implicatum]|nr:PP-loop family protein [Sarocladium implicatum]